MRFGRIPTADASGAVLAHATRAGDRMIGKGTLLDGADCAALGASGVPDVVVVRFDADDVPENEAARRAGAATAGAGLVADPPVAGRVNLRAGAAGVLLVDAPSVDALNRVDEAVTLATLLPFAPAAAGQIVATVKIIPFAAPDRALLAWEAIEAPLRLVPFRPRRAALIQTRLPGVSERALDRARAVTERRLRSAGSVLGDETRCPHAADAVSDAIGRALAAGADLVLVAGASAIVDRHDVLPEAIERAGGAILHLGAPLDPGNLLLSGRVGAVPVLGLPGCARSPRLNGIDLVLRRALADLPLDAHAIMGMGVGGLLADTPARGQGREAAAVPPAEPASAGSPAAPVLAAPVLAAPVLAALVLAAGRSTRMGANKLLLDLDGATLAERAVDAALASRASPVLVVVGHEAAAVRARLAGRDVTIVENPAHEGGLSTSIRAGLDAAPADAAGVVVLLADMPEVGPALIDALLAKFDPSRGVDIVVPARDGRRGHPVIWGRRFFADLRARTGDTGGRALIERHPDAVATLAVTGDAPFLDLDTPADWEAFRRRRND